MDSIFNAIILAIIQGLTEFLPVSSSGHLVIFQQLFHFNAEDNILMNVILHLGTMVATLIVFKEELLDIVRAFFSKRLLNIRSIQDIKQDNSLWLVFIIILGTIPTVLIGFLFKDTFESLTKSLFAVSIALLVTGTILFSTKFVNKSKKEEYNKITIWDTLIIGFFQGIAIIPGISRSGFTISTGLWLGIRRDKIGRYSFLLSLPAIFGANLLKMAKTDFSHFSPAPYIVGFFISFLTGYFALKFFLSFVNKGKLQYFSFYCWAIGLLALIVSFYQ